MRRLVLGVGLAVGVLAGLEPVAARDPVDGFCLADRVTGAVEYYGCQATPIPHRSSKRVTCLNDTRTGDIVVKRPDDLVRLAPGKDACNPWHPAPDADLACFCLTVPETAEVVHYGCWDGAPGVDAVSAPVICLAGKRTGRLVIDGADAFRRVPGGEGQCNPCVPGAAGRLVPLNYLRGDDETEDDP